MASSSKVDEAGRLHSRVQSGSVPSASNSSQSPSASNAATTNSAVTPTASITALPRISSSTSSTPTAHLHSSSPRASSMNASSGVRSATGSMVGSGHASNTTRSAPVTSQTTMSSNSPSRREGLPTGSNGSESNHSAASSMSSQNSALPTASGSSLFGFLGNPRTAADDAPFHHPYGWRAMSVSGTSTREHSHHTNAGNNTDSTSSSRSFNTTTSAAAQSTNAPPRPAITSFLGSVSTSNWNGQIHRGSTVGALQQHHQQQQQQRNLTGSPARSNAIVSGSSSPWAGHPSSGLSGSASGWTLADPAAWSGWASAGRLCSGFEENQVISFTWLIPEAQLLRDEVEQSPLPSDGGRSISAGAGKSEVWTTQPIFGDGKWKLELVRTSRENDEASEPANQKAGGGKEDDTIRSTTVLSVYLTSMVLDYSPADLEIPASIMLGIKPAQSQTKTSRSGEWIWREFIDFTFRRENEYYECHKLPSLSEILANKEVANQDAFSLTIQISTGPRAAGPPSNRLRHAVESNHINPFVVQNSQLVHHSLISGLERLLDDKSTGDVVLIVRERGVRRRGSKGGRAADGQGQDIVVEDKIWTLPVGAPMYDEPGVGQGDDDGVQIYVRDRLLWAHSSILGARSEFFHDMLQSNFVEGQERDLPSLDSPGEMQIRGRRVKTLHIKDADYTTIYWFLRYLYLEEVEFVPSEDVRCSALDDEWMEIGQVSGGEGIQMALWHWTSIGEVEAIHSNSSLCQPVGGKANQSDEGYQHSTSHSRSVSRHGQSSGVVSQSPSSAPVSPLHQQGATSPKRARGGIPHEMYNTLQRRVASDCRQQPTHKYPIETATSGLNSLRGGMTFTDGCSASQHPQHPLLMDPHEHPCEKPPPASALALYRLAHRYHQQSLVRLAQSQLINSLTPQTAFPTLLATNLYADLHEHVKAYVLDRWDVVSQTKEFERCCDEVSAGEWGIDAGRALRTFMRSLLSPNRAA